MKNLHTLIAAFFIFLSYQVSAQEVTLTTNDMTVQPGENFELNIKVADFQDIAAIQFAMFFDPSIIEYVGYSDLGVPNGPVDHITAMAAAEGRIRFSWYDPDPMVNGVTLDDGSTLFVLNFKAVGAAAQATPFTIEADTIFPQMPIEVVNANSVALDVNIENSMVTIDGVSSAFETKTSEFVLFQNNPNPFIEKTNITFELNHTSNTLLSIFDHTGKIVYEQSKTYSGGSHTVQIARNLFQSAGSYFYTLKTDNATATRQLVVQ